MSKIIGKEITVSMGNNINEIKLLWNDSYSTEYVQFLNNQKIIVENTTIKVNLIYEQIEKMKIWCESIINSDPPQNKKVKILKR